MAIIFERIELSYGRHHDAFDFATSRADASGNGSLGGTGDRLPGRPFVILGPNGAGKTTLIEAPVRVLFGFRRVRREGREAHRRRRPWAGGPYRALVALHTPAGGFTFARDFQTDGVRVTEAGRKTPVFDAEANPSRSGESVQRYREILREVIGITELEDYRRTACVFQGDLLGTGLSVDLIRVAAGGHADVESATERLQTEYGVLTVQPIAPDASRRRKPGEVESLAVAIEEMEAEIAQAREAEARRIPLVRRREDCLARIAELATARREVGEKVDRLLEGLPDADRLDPTTLPTARREFGREEADRLLLDDAERAVRGAVDAAVRALELHGAETDEEDSMLGPESPRAPGPAPMSGGRTGLVDRARCWLRVLQEAVATERDECMAPSRLRLSEIAKSRFDLPDDVEATLSAVGAARRARLESAGRLRAELGAIERELVTEGRGLARALSLERELEALRDRSRAVQARAAAYRHAYAFVSGAYEAFRRTDEERLLDAISGHVAALSGGTLGPLEAAGGLDEAMIRAGERSLPLASPPLSYGQLHMALLSVRIGAADFLAGLGVGLPLLIDDPFVHLDERSAADLWGVLGAIAMDRQVIVSTQDRLVLEHLGVAADLDLGGAMGPTPSRAGVEELSR